MIRKPHTLRATLTALTLVVCLLAPSVGAAHAQGTVHIVQPGENLFRIGLKYGVAWTDIMQANGLSSVYIYAGQRLVIPVAQAAPPAPVQPQPAEPPVAAPPPTGAQTYIVQRGDTLFKIATRFGLSTAELAAANNIYNPSLIYVGQTLTIPAGGSAPAGAPAPSASGGGKRILIDISEQRMYVYQDGTLIWTFVVSTGMPGAATRPGNYAVQNKIPSAYGSTWNIWMPNWLGIYWAGSLQNGIHALPILPGGGRLWDGYLGTPVSYGCIILGIQDAQTLYDWAEVGTAVDIQY